MLSETGYRVYNEAGEFFAVGMTTLGEAQDLVEILISECVESGCQDPDAESCGYNSAHGFHIDYVYENGYSQPLL